MGFCGVLFSTSSGGGTQEYVKATCLLVMFTLVPIIMAYESQMPLFKIVEVVVLVGSGVGACWLHRIKLTKVST